MKEEDLDKIRDLYKIKNDLEEKLLQINYYKKAELYLLLQFVGSNVTTGARIIGSKEHPHDVIAWKEIVLPEPPKYWDLSTGENNINKENE